VRRSLAFLLRHLPALVAAAILVVLFVRLPGARRLDFWLSLSEQYFAAGALAFVLTPIMLTGGIDLSVGSVAVCVSVLGAALLRDAQWPLVLALAAGIGGGLLAGLLNGTLVTLGVVPLVATLATRELFRGLALSIGGDTGITGLPLALNAFWRTPVLGVPLPLLVLIALFALFYLLLHHTWLGRMVFAVGDNETAARFAAVPVQRLKFGLYALSGVVAGVCGLALMARYGAGKANAEKSLELTAIACVVLGGLRITGGAGHLGGTALGVVTVAALLAALSTVPPNVRDMTLGALLIGVAVCNEAARRWAARQEMIEAPTEGDRSVR
jgi:ribose/xylose/arabinose/galactoside ABC-type transport system permease subunit